MKMKKKKGFTLIELLIVVAIIAILAAIAIPQFGQYRIRGYNAAANSDIRNAKTAEEALFADYQGYGDTSAVGVYTSGPVAFVTTDTAATSRNVSVGLSNNVHMIAKTNTNDETSGANYLIFTKHKQGDRIFGADSNVTTIYWSDGTIGSNMADPGIDSSSLGDISGVGWTPL
jgi:prepilin-type N-terminal cleavage/methylation domain-containing protein